MRSGPQAGTRGRSAQAPRRTQTKGRRVRVTIRLLFVLMCCAAIARAASPEADARQVVDRLFAAPDALSELPMTPEMARAMTPEAVTGLRDRLLRGLGEPGEVGEAWHEDDVDGYRRYRVPVVFAAETIDLRVVLDGEGRLAGLFQLPHVPSPAERKAGPPLETDVVEAIAGHWEGHIELPASDLFVKVDLVRRDGWWEGSIDIPAQGAVGLLLTGIAVAADSVGFALADIPGEPVFSGRPSPGEIAGVFSQGGLEFPFRLTRETASAVVRPQDPRPPYPYLAEEVVFANGDISLAGTLTYPNAPGPFAAVLLLSGSGAQNRDEEVFDHRPFHVLADHLTRRGVAVLRVDDRGVGGSTGDRSISTTEDYCDDALAGVRFLAAHPRVDPARIGLIGHSEGGIIAPMAAVRCDSVAFIVLLAGTGVPGDEILHRQVELMSRAQGVPEASLAIMLEAQRRLMELIRTDAADEAVREQLRISTRAMGGPGLDEDVLESQVETEFARVTSPWFRFFVLHDPRPVLARVTVPVLALCGSKDLQVESAQSLPEIDRALAEGGNPDVTVWELPGLNHLFQTAGTGSIAEYWGIEETFAPAALEAVSDWVSARF